VTTDNLLGVEKEHLLKGLNLEQEKFVMEMINYFKMYNTFKSTLVDEIGLEISPLM
jgi:hypothetical protein